MKSMLMSCQMFWGIGKGCKRPGERDCFVFVLLTNVALRYKLSDIRFHPYPMESLLYPVIRFLDPLMTSGRSCMVLDNGLAIMLFKFAFSENRT